MTSAFIVGDGASDAPDLVCDLEGVGIVVVGVSVLATMVPEVIRRAPDLVICHERHPGDALFAGTASLQSLSPRPVIVFTGDPDADKINRAAAYVVNGYGPNRLRPLIHVAQARFRQEQMLRVELSEVQHRFDERKLTDRAKGILMRVRNIGEDEAYKVLRSAAMQGKQRIGQVSQTVIDAARFAEAVNRAGQLRMMSQRLVKLFALMCAAADPGETARLCRESLEQIEGNLAVLGRTLSKPTFGDLIDGVAVPWGALKLALAGPPTLARLPEVDRLAERLLAQSEALTRTLQTAGFAAALHVINVSGRQRMLSQRLAKQAIVAGLLPSAPLDRSAMAATERSFVEGLAFLRGIPLTSPEIAALLDGAAAAWAAFQPALARGGDPAARAVLAALSEELLTLFGRLTDCYERGIQVLTEQAR